MTEDEEVALGIRIRLKDFDLNHLLTTPDKHDIIDAKQIGKEKRTGETTHFRTGN